MGKSISIIQGIKTLFKRHGIILLLFLATMLTIFEGGMHVYFKDLFSVIAVFALFPQISKTKNIWPLFLFCVFNTLFSYVNTISGSFAELVSFLLSPIAFYIFGYSVMNKCETEREISLFFLLTFSVSCLLLWVNMIRDANMEGIINVSRHVYNEEGIIEHSATLLGLIASIGISGISFSIMYGGKYKAYSILFLTVSLLSMFSVVHLVNRTGILVFVVTILVTILYSIKGNRGSILVALLIGVAFYIFFGYADSFTSDLFTAYEGRTASMASGGYRFERWRDSIVNLFEYPFGWRTHNIMGYSHNLWLDVAASVGLIPFVFLLIFSVRSYKNTISLYKTKGNKFAGFLIGVNACFFVSAFVEPVLEGMSTYFYMMCLIWGVQQSYIESISYKFNE